MVERHRFLDGDADANPSGRPTSAWSRVALVVVTGTLGAGKTTLIAGLARRADMVGTAIIVNEVAAVGIDRAILVDAGAGDVTELANGCLCCAAGTDLARAVGRLIAAAEARGGSLARIVIETSGAADPGPILRQVCFHPALRPRIRYGGVLTLFDALAGAAILARDPVGYRQIGHADAILLTKRDLVGPEAAAAASDLLRLLNPAAPVLRDAETAGSFVARAGRAGGRLTWPRFSAEVATEAHGPVLRTWSILGRRAIDWSAAERAMLTAFHRWGGEVLRTKGLIWTDGDPRPLLVHGIAGSFHRPVRLNAFDGAPETRAAVIGFAGAEPLAAAMADALGGKILGSSERSSGA